MKKITSREIAISGVSAALAIVALLLSRYIEVATLVFMAVASVCLALPLFMDSARGCVFAYVASAGLSLIFIGYVSAMPYILMFGPYPILFYYLKKYLKKWYFCLPIKVVFACLTFLATFYACGLSMADFPIVDKFPLYQKWLIIYAGLIGVFIMFDFAYAGVLFNLKIRLKNVIK